MANKEKLYSVGELARSCSVTVRTLQYYDLEGLLSPSQYSEGGRRLYTREDIFLLQQILFLKSFGFSLADIRDHLMNTDSVDKITLLFTRQREIILEQIEKLKEMSGFLLKVTEEMQQSGELGTEKLVTIMGMMKQKNPYAFLMRYFKNDEIKSLINSVDINDIETVQNKLPGMFEELIELNSSGADPEGPAGQALAAKWWALVEKYSGGDPGMMGSMMNMGIDVDNWPENAGEIKAVTKDFLAKAFSKYLTDNPIKFGGV